MAKKRFKIRADLKYFIENVLRRRGINYEIITSGNTLMLEAELSGEYFHKVVIRAMCEKKDFERNPDGIVEVPMVHYSEVNNKEVMDWVDGRPHIVFQPLKRYK